MQKTYIGIDPGAKGALALISDVTAVFPYEPQTYITILRGIYEKKTPCVCCIEQVHSMTGQGIASSFQFGTAYGYLLGLLEAFAIPYQAISPRKWKNEFGLTSDKTTSIEVCRRLFPDVSLRRTEKSRKDDDGYAEALLMALYAKRKF